MPISSVDNNSSSSCYEEEEPAITGEEQRRRLQRQHQLQLLELHNHVEQEEQSLTGCGSNSSGSNDNSSSSSMSTNKRKVFAEEKLIQQTPADDALLPAAKKSSTATAVSIWSKSKSPEESMWKLPKKGPAADLSKDPPAADHQDLVMMLIILSSEEPCKIVMDENRYSDKQRNRTIIEQFRFPKRCPWSCVPKDMLAESHSCEFMVPTSNNKKTAALKLVGDANLTISIYPNCNLPVDELRRVFCL